MVVKIFLAQHQSASSLVFSSRPHRRCPQLAVTLLILLLTFFRPSPALAQNTSSPAQMPAPAQRIDLSRVQYRELSAGARLSGQSNMSLDFLDRDHVLLTFNPKKLLIRLAECPPSHDDHLAHAVVFEVSSGKIVKESDWYLHDHKPYLWPLDSGRVLLRRLNNLYAVDASLHEKLLYSSPTQLLWVDVTPDGKQIIVETPDQVEKATDKPISPKTHVTIGFLDADSLKVVRAIKLGQPVNLGGTSTGFATVSASGSLSGNVWLVQFGPVARQRTDVARVRSARAPDILYISNNSMLIGRDSQHTLGYSVSAFTVTGNRLWRQHWPHRWYDPTIRRSDDGSRFAVSGVSAISDKPAVTPNGPSDETQIGVEQKIQVFDSASGDALLTVNATPVVVKGQNFSLSPDGRRLAVVHGSTIEVYDLPAMSPEELAKYTAVKADVPGLYIPPELAKQAARQPDSFADDSGFGADSEAGADSAKSGSQTSAPAAAGPSADDLQSGAPTFKTGTQVVALDVVATDSTGHIVKHLPQKDFLVKEDGKPQNVRYFDEVSKTEAATAPVPPRPTEAASKAPPPLRYIFDNRTPTLEDSAVTVILYDELNTPIADQQRAKMAMLRFLANKPKGARFAFCVLSRSLRMVQGFTPDEAILAKAVKAGKGSLTYSGLQNEDAQDQQTIGWLERGAAGAAQRAGGLAASQQMLDTAAIMQQQETDRRAYDLQNRIWITMDAFTQMARYLSAIPGRKSLIWLSGSFPLGIFPGIDFENPDAANTTYMGQAKQAANLLAESHVALYPMDVKGLTGYTMTANAVPNSPITTQPSQDSFAATAGSSQVNQRFTELANLGAPGGIGANLPGGDSPFMEQAMEHGIMDQIAADTGGKAFYNSNSITQAMTVVMDQEANYYSLAYTPLNRKYDGKFRKIRISLASPDKKLHLAYRTGYFAVDPDAPDNPSRDASTGFGLAAMQHGSPLSHQLLFKARVIPVGKPRMVNSAAAVTARKSKKKKGQPSGPVEMQRYAIDYAVATSQLRLDVTKDGLRHGIFNFMVTSFDNDGGLRSSVVSRATTDLKQDGYQEILQGGLRLHQEVDIPVKSASLRMGVQDALSGHMGTIEAELPIKAPPEIERASSHHQPEIEPD